MTNLLIEVDEALKQERAARLWKDYGGFVIGTVALIILGTAGMSGYRVWDKSVKTSQTEKYLEALDTKNAQTLIELAESLRPGIKALSLWRAAALFLEDGKKKEAMDIYASILNDAKTPNELRHLASYQIARLTAQDDPVMGLTLLEKSANDFNNPWKLLARLDVAVLQAHHKKNYRVARDHLATILNESDLPKSLERKARSLDSLYAMQAPETSKSPKTETPENLEPAANTPQSESKTEEQPKKENSK